ncbi:MAG: proprotein convertase P-domain-containing protein, partial [Bacteroidota bacterium]
TWNAIPFASSYTIEVAESPSFNDLILTASGITQTFFDPEFDLNANSIYYWRVKGVSTACGDGLWSPIYSFQTELLQCIVYNSVDVPISISGSGTPTEYSDLVVEDDVILTDVDVIAIDIQHTWVEDLRVSVISPEGDSIMLFQDICGEQDDVFLSFDDDAAPGAIPCPPTTGDFYQPQESLSTFNGGSSMGTWRLKVFDDTNQDGGELRDWALRLCGPPISTTVPIVTIVPDSVFLGESLGIGTEQLSASCEGGTAATYTLVSLPSQGMLILDGMELGVGDTFTQSGIDNGLLAYVHDGLTAEPDQFEFTIACENGTYVGGLVYGITILDLTSVTDWTNTSFQLYPNPASEELYIQLDTFKGPAYRLQLVDLLGRIVLDEPLNSTSTRIPVARLSPGMYMTLLYQDGVQVGAQQVVITR